MWLTGPAAPWHVGSSQTRARTRVPCISRQILNHCATREALFPVFDKREQSCSKCSCTGLFCGHIFSFLLSKYLEMELQGHRYIFLFFVVVLVFFFYFSIVDLQYFSFRCVAKCIYVFSLRFSIFIFKKCQMVFQSDCLHFTFPPATYEEF